VLGPLRARSRDRIRDRMSPSTRRIVGVLNGVEGTTEAARGAGLPPSSPSVGLDIKHRKEEEDCRMLRSELDARSIQTAGRHRRKNNECSETNGLRPISYL
jgi:hypothetical protein